MPPTIVTIPQALPDEFYRSVFLFAPKEFVPDASFQTLDDCFLFIPHSTAGSPMTQEIEWEDQAIAISDVVVFWLPADASDEHILKCSVAFGRWCSSGKVIYGREGGDAEQRFGHLDVLARNEKLTIHPTFDDCIQDFNKKTLNKEGRVSPGQLRRAGERCVPLHVWQHVAFRAWVANMKRVGNRLDGARFEWAFRVGPSKAFTLYWAVHADVFVAAEGRNKANEIVIGRNDIKCVLPYRLPPPPPGGGEAGALDAEVVLIKEFRSPATTADGFIHELPGGSGFRGLNPLAEAAHELQEEVGVAIPAEDLPRRVRAHGPRQLAGTTSCHEAHLFSVELTAEEMKECRRRAEEKETLGVEAESERTYIEVVRLSEAFESNLVDWSMLGMMHSVLHQALTDSSKGRTRDGHSSLEEPVSNNNNKITKLPAPARPAGQEEEGLRRGQGASGALPSLRSNNNNNKKKIRTTGLERRPEPRARREDDPRVQQQRRRSLEKVLDRGGCSLA